MAGKTYGTKGYSTYTDIPARRGSYDQGPKNPINQYAVETKNVERVRGPAIGYRDFVGSPSKIELLNEYVYSPTMSSSPNAGYDPNHGLNYDNSSPPKFHNDGSWTTKTTHFSNPDKYHPSSPVHGYHLDVAHPIQFGPGAREVRTGNTSGTNKSWQSAGPPKTHHPVTTSTSNINKALGFLESVTHSSRSEPRERGVLDELSTRAQPQEPQKRYARPAFVSKPNNNIYKTRY
ncbi:hypothetical protein L2E82_08818 [Cichorium intybus]|uniref:Uncharacterized protein n=1 Tax=Cichorium intybus TaxID=13427 RepID=A0ACB9G7M5_CICIN|nr:hypothetical protein L2E82_08818 [Cichorium intybus]